MSRLDKVLEGERASVIKIDVEGYEMPVLRGAKTTMNNPALLAVVMELNGSGARYGVDDMELNALMLDHGFAPRSYDPLKRALITVPAHNASGNRIYVRDETVVAQRLRDSPPFTVAGGTRI